MLLLSKKLCQIIPNKYGVNKVLITKLHKYIIIAYSAHTDYGGVGLKEKKYISINDRGCIEALSSNIKEYIEKRLDGYNSIVVFCIGTDRAAGDSLGPLVGTKLISMGLENVMGTIDMPVHAVNIGEKIDLLYSLYDKPLVVAVDACLGIYDHIGSLSIWEGSLLPGAGVSKRLREVGDISIAGIVNKWSVNGLSQLRSTRLSFVKGMSDIIAEGIYKAINEVNY